MEIPEEILSIISPGAIPEDLKNAITIEAAKSRLEASGTPIDSLPEEYFDSGGAFETSNLKEELNLEVNKLSEHVSSIANDTTAMINPGSTISSINGVIKALGVVLPLITSLGVTGAALDSIKIILTIAGTTMTAALAAYTALGAIPIVGPVSYPPDPTLFAKVPIIVAFISTL